MCAPSTGATRIFYWIDAERRRTRSQENSVYTDGSTLESALERYGLETEGEPDPVFNFQSYEEAPRALDDGTAYSLSFRFSPYEDVRFDYSTEDGRYYKVGIRPAAAGCGGRRPTIPGGQRLSSVHLHRPLPGRAALPGES